MCASEMMSRAVAFIDAGATANRAAAPTLECDVGVSPAGSEIKRDGSVIERDLLNCFGARDLRAADHSRRFGVTNEGGHVVGGITVGARSRTLRVDSAPLQNSLIQLTGEGARKIGAH